MSVIRGISKSSKFLIIDSTNIVKETMKRIDIDLIYSKDVAKIATEAALLAQNIKTENTKISLILENNGALKKVIAKSTKNGNIAVNAYIDEEKNKKLIEAINNNDKENIDKLFNLNQAKLQFSFDYGLKQPYISTFEVRENLLELAMNDFYEKSEQTKSILICSIKYNDKYEIEKSSGLLIQLLPDGDEKFLEWIASKLERLLNITDMLKNGFSLEKIAHIIYEDDDKIFENESIYKGLPYDKLPKKEDFTILSKKEVIYECDCNRLYMEKAIKSALSMEEIKNIIKEDGNIQITCNFCKEKYEFNEIK